MRVKLNGEWQEWPADECSLLELLAERGVGPETGGVAVAINLEVAPRAAWAETRLKDGDEIEIVTARQGG